MTYHGSFRIPARRPPPRPGETDWDWFLRMVERFFPGALASRCFSVREAANVIRIEAPDGPWCTWLTDHGLDGTDGRARRDLWITFWCARNTISAEVAA